MVGMVHWKKKHELLIKNGCDFIYDRPATPLLLLLFSNPIDTLHFLHSVVFYTFPTFPSGFDFVSFRLFFWFRCHVIVVVMLLLLLFVSKLHYHNMLSFSGPAL